MRYTGHVKRLEVDIEYLIGIPKMLAEYCGGANLTDLSLTFNAFSHIKANLGYYPSFKEAVLELWALKAVCVKDVVEFKWVQMEETF